MLGEVIKGILSILWGIVRAIVLEAIVILVQRAILVAIVRPVGATGQLVRAALEVKLNNYNERYLYRVRRQAALGMLVLVVLWTGGYWLFGSGGVLVVGGITLLIVGLGWFNRLVVPDVD